ncbi:MAG: hypothetical protein IKX67_06315 [Bacteroidales bacterium]|nr:hypothetical protein [Bacteroidales bacterium]
MTNTKHYQAPDVYLLPLSYESLLCQSMTESTGNTEDYELVEGFNW